MLSSLQEGIRALPDGIEAAMFTLVDHPAVEAATLDRLISERERTEAPLVIRGWENAAASRDRLARDSGRHAAAAFR